MWGKLFLLLLLASALEHRFSGLEIKACTTSAEGRASNHGWIKPVTLKNEKKTPLYGHTARCPSRVNAWTIDLVSEYYVQVIAYTLNWNFSFSVIARVIISEDSSLRYILGVALTLRNNSNKNKNKNNRKAIIVCIIALLCIFACVALI